ncbi:hypothetical protein N781_05780 [Pontibacillus halophilus JSM 076056 = DSM 19796]|uniref:Competence protein ComG n=1 Tax=Pontibacillus halophilus JSM 076056 = DSM 19796 TaxID=1385510 RepID=A0A0A5GIB9_9BACI|nr:hypothetical protein N781_05780 [Pontibacillus halophilus JSM 076056 = DSM 19796]
MEMSVVLFILITTLSLTVHIGLQLLDKQRLNLFIQQLEDDLLAVQQQSIAESHYHRIYFSKDAYAVYQGTKKLYEREIPSSTSIRFLTLTNPIHYNESGTIQKPGTMKISNHGKEHTLVFPFGSSRFYVKP